MGYQNDDDDSSKYQHTDYNEYLELTTKIKARIITHKNEDDIYNAYKGKDASEFTGANATAKAAAKVKANRQLYGILVSLIGNKALLRYLGQYHEDDGEAALNHISQAHSPGEDDNKTLATHTKYLNMVAAGIPDGASIEEANAILTTMSSLKGELDAQLHDTGYKIGMTARRCTIAF